jgi:hypothetical protein
LIEKLTEKLASGDLAEINIPTSTGKQKFMLKAGPLSDTIHVLNTRGEYVDKGKFNEKTMQETSAKAEAMTNTVENRQQETFHMDFPSGMKR